MTTQEVVLTTRQVADRFNELTQTGQWNDILDELYAVNAISIEPISSGVFKNAEGLDAIKEKGKQFGEILEEMHGGYSEPPVVGGNHFALAMGMDVTMKGQDRTQMHEIAVYEVKEGKIVKEQFFY